MADERLRRTVEILARELAMYRCGACGGHDSHDVCEQPNWDRIGKDMLAALNGEST